MNSALVLAITASGQKVWWPPDDSIAQFWVVFGLAAQGIFTARFVVQWIASERRRKSHVPIAFWYLSIVGAAMLLTFAVWDRNPVLALGQTVGFTVYVRNLMLLRREKLEAAAEGETLQTGTTGQ